ncbi:MAG: imidazolonepropionase [Actinobacteria bacterium]|uniref:imidazolonepropionase n=1 Tax=freshwater metagenome TaxID=449393 RepID=A0A6J6WM20_9ZZZZ|nr:imidazolonepropionase [Actinomycetota bacterium]
MTSTLVRNIGQLVTNDPQHDGTKLGLIENAALLIEDGVVAWAGSDTDAPTHHIKHRFDAHGRAVIPGFVDSHTHMIFAGDRSKEFRARMLGESYTAGGIAHTVEKTRAASDQTLRNNAQSLLNEAYSSGTTTIEIKSGYGLTVNDERRSLEIAQSFTDETTFLGAHVVPVEYKKNPKDYVDLVTGPMLDAVAPFSKWIDVFCDKGAFSVDDARTILKVGISKGLLPRLHANQLQEGHGVRLGVELDAASVDHVSHLSEKDIEALSTSKTVATLLPGAEFSTRSAYPDVRPLLEASITVALASDCNPGSSYTTNMPFIIAVAVREMHFSPEQALWSATMGGAKALRREDIGHLFEGARANFSILNADSYIHLAYRPGVNLVEQVWRDGLQIK